MSSMFKCKVICVKIQILFTDLACVALIYIYICICMETRFLCVQDFALQYTIMVFNVGVGTSDQIRLQTCRICIVCQFSGVFFFFFI